MKWLAFLFFVVAVTFVSREAHAGYTHYWKWKRDPDPVKLERAVAEMNRIVDASKDILDVPDAEPPSQLVMFNGIGPNAHETFGFPLAPFAGTPDFNFVKTAWKPYDAVVTACLIVARDHFSHAELEISSDGDFTDWKKGRALYAKVLDRAANDPISPRAPDADEPSPVLEPPETPKEDGGRLRAVVISIAVIGVLVVVRLLQGGR